MKLRYKFDRTTSSPCSLTNERHAVGIWQSPTKLQAMFTIYFIIFKIKNVP